MADANQENQTPSLNRPASTSPLKDAPFAQKAFNAHYSASAPHQQNSNNDQMAAQSNVPANSDNYMSSTNLKPPPGTPNLSRPANPTLLPGFSITDLPPCSPNQPPRPPPYKSPYAQSAPFLAPNNGQSRVPTPTYPQNIPQTFAQPRSVAPPPAPAPSGPPPQPSNQGRISSTPGYTAYAQEIRRTATQYKVRSDRLSPVSHVRNVLNITSDTGFVPTMEQRLAGVMAGNPMINSVKVIQNLAEGYEDLCDKIDDRDATIRQLHAAQTQMQAEHAQRLQQAVDDAIRVAVRPLPKSTQQQAVDLKDRDDKIAALEAFVGDQAKRIVELEAAKDHAQAMQFDVDRRHARELNDARGQQQAFNQRQGNGQVHGSDQNPGHAQGLAFSQPQGHSQDQSQIFDQGQAFIQPHALDQGPEFDFEKLFAQSTSQEQNQGYHQGQQFPQDNQQNFCVQPSYILQQPGMPGNPQDMFLQQGLSIVPQRDSQGVDDPFGMGGQQGNLFQQEMSARRARTTQQSFGPQNMSGQPGPQGFQNMQGQGLLNPSTSGRQQRMPSQSQQSPPRSQNMPDQLQRKASSPNRHQNLQNIQGQGYGPTQGKSQRNAASPNPQQAPQAKGRKGRQTRNSQQGSAQQDMSGQAVQQPGLAFQNNQQDNYQANQGPSRRTRASQQVSGQQDMSGQAVQQTAQPFQNGYQDNHQANQGPICRTRSAQQGAGQQNMSSQQTAPGFPNNHQNGHDQGQGQPTAPPTRGRKRNASSPDGQQMTQTEDGKITLDTLRNKVRQKLNDGGFKRSF